MKKVIVGMAWSGLLLSLFACGGGSGSSFPAPVLYGFDPAVAQKGQSFTVYGQNFVTDGTTRVSIAHIECPIVSITPTQVVVTVPNELRPSSGIVEITNSYGVRDSNDQFVVGTPSTIAEIEPNDAGASQNYLNETFVGGNRSLSGTLASTSDHDQFLVSALVEGHQYSINVSPKLVNSVDVNGMTVVLDGTGTATFTVPLTTTRMHLGLSGGTGAYTVTIAHVN